MRDSDDVLAERSTNSVEKNKADSKAGAPGSAAPGVEKKDVRQSLTGSSDAVTAVRMMVQQLNGSRVALVASAHMSRAFPEARQQIVLQKRELETKTRELRSMEKRSKLAADERLMKSVRPPQVSFRAYVRLAIATDCEHSFKDQVRDALSCESRSCGRKCA